MVQYLDLETIANFWPPSVLEILEQNPPFKVKKMALIITFNKCKWWNLFTVSIGKLGVCFCLLGFEIMITVDKNFEH